MDTTTPTETVVDQSSSDVSNESLLETSEQDTAVEQTDTDSSETQDSDSTSSSTEEKEEDVKFAKFAKSQGIEDLSSLSEREKKLLKVAHDNQKNYRKTAESEANKRKIVDELQEFSAPSPDDSIDEVVLKRMARLEAKDATNDFWNLPENREERKYEPKMVEILNQERKDFGADAAWRLAQNLPRLLREAKSLSGAFDSEAAREAGRREERERLRKLQEGASDASHATVGASKVSTKINREWINTTYDPSNPEHRVLLDESIRRGDLY